jgi:glycosyltransferase involved in cell wall biosynthesis
MVSNQGRGQRLLSRVPSRLLNLPHSAGLKNSSLVTDALLLQSLQSLITTRAELHVAAARFAPPHIRLVAQEHTHYYQRSQPVRRSVAKCMERIDALVVLTERDRQDYIQESSWSPSKVSVIPNAVQGSLHHPFIERVSVIVAAGRLTAQEGFDRLIEAFAPLARSRPDWRLYIFGKDPDHRVLQDQINTSGLSHQIKLMGWEDNLDEAFSKAALLALSSRFEGIANPQLRMSMGQAALFDARSYQLAAVGPQWESLFQCLASGSTAPAGGSRRRGKLGGRPSLVGRSVLVARSGGLKGWSTVQDQRRRRLRWVDP